ncbi:ANTAR domain-containing protein [Streptomyces sp. NPDC055506]
MGRAETLLLSRYRLGSQQEAFELLRQTSQRFNIKLHTLADAAPRLPALAPTVGQRFAPRPRSGPPPLLGLALSDGASRTSDGAVLKAAMRRVLDLTDTDMANVPTASGSAEYQPTGQPVGRAGRRG